jgi:NAD(P)-dependent dehydrogenase (short-subunit alcohol dehydrogenase family)
MSAPITVVTGANSGIGRATAVHLAAKGHTVVGTVRSVAKADKLQAMATDAGVTIDLVELDVADGDSVRSGFTEILDRHGRVDHLVNNAGVGGNGVVEETSPKQFLDVMNVDLCGAIRCAQAVLPQMRDRGSGTIVNITSVAGCFGAMAQAPYVASKWALEGVSEELALELAPFGIRVAIIEPGVTRSAIFAKNNEAPNESGAYDSQYRRMFGFYAAGIRQATPAEEVAEMILHAIETDEPSLRYSVSWAASEIIEGRSRMSEGDWVALGALTSDDEYLARFKELFGVDLSN